MKNRWSISRIKRTWLRRLVLVLAAPFAWLLMVGLLACLCAQGAAQGAWEELRYHGRQVRRFSCAVKEAWRCEDLREGQP